MDALKHANPADYYKYAGNLLTTSIYTAAAIYNSDILDGQVWYFHLPNTIDSEVVVNANIKAKDMGITLSGNYATTSMADETGLEDKTYYDITAKYNKAGIHALAGYANSSDDNGVVTTAFDSPLGHVIPVQQRYNIANEQDTEAWYAMLGYDVTNALNLSLRYASFDDNTADNDDADEWVVQGDYKYNKKLSFQAYYSVYDEDEDGGDNNEFRFQALYKF